MSQITWDQYDGFIHSDQVSDMLRLALRPHNKFRQFAEIQGPKDGVDYNRGEKFYWDVYDTPERKNRRLAETERMPSSTVGKQQHSVTVTEMGEAIERTQKAELLSKDDWEAITKSNMSFMAAAQFDVETFLQFKATPLRAAPTSGNSTTSVTVSTGGSTAITNNVALGTGHIKAISDYMQNRNIPPHYQTGAYYAITNVDTLRPFKNELESIHQHTPTGLAYIKAGEVGRYEDFDFIQQTMIPAGGANDAAVYDPHTNTAEAWDNGLSSWAMFFGDEPVTEASVVPEEVRAKLAEDYGRDRGAAWYYLGGFANTHPDAANARIVMWDSAA